MDLKVLKRLRNRRKFRQIIRQVRNNLYWLMDPNDIQLGEDVKANVTLIYKKKKKQKGGLTLEEKCIMRKRPEWRTEYEKDLLYKTIGGLKYFRKWPEDVIYKLISCIDFVYFEPGRVITKQHQRAQALYFIMSGSVELYQEVFDEILQIWVHQEVGTLGVGSMFGEVSLLQKKPRSTSVKSMTHVELLMVHRDDFDDTLESTVKKKWDEIKEGLASFPYFEGLTEDSQTECCTISHLKDFGPDEIIFSHQAKKVGHVYFILDGTAKLIEKTYVQKQKINNETVYSLYNPEDRYKPESKIPHQTPTSVYSVQRCYFTDRKEEVKNEIYEKCPVTLGLLNKFGTAPRMRHEMNVDYRSQHSIYFPLDVHCHFIEVCTFTKQACFFENELFDHRYLISMTPMKILVIPMYWLLLHNKANIWYRLIRFLNRSVPDRETVFNCFVSNRKWIEYKKKITRAALGKKKDYLTTSWSDVPISLRIAEVYKGFK